jgi:hypothetical protein
MDRLNRALAGGCLAAALAMVFSAGCRSMRNDVPPGKPYSTTGGAPPTVGFNSEPPRNPAANSGMYGAMTPAAPGQDPSTGSAGGNLGSQYGTPPPGGSPYGAPTGNRYGSLTSPAGAN